MFWIFWIGNFLNFSNWKIKKFSEFFQFQKLSKFQKISNFRIVHPFDIVKKFRRFIFSIFIFYWSNFPKFGRSKFERSLIFKFEKSTILKLDCVKILTLIQNVIFELFCTGSASLGENRPIRWRDGQSGKSKNHQDQSRANDSDTFSFWRKSRARRRFFSTLIQRPRRIRHTSQKIWLKIGNLNKNQNL